MERPLPAAAEPGGNRRLAVQARDKETVRDGADLSMDPARPNDRGATIGC